MLGPWLSLAMFYIVCFLRSRAVNRKKAGLWLLDDLCANPANALGMVCGAVQGRAVQDLSGFCSFKVVMLIGRLGFG